MSITLYDRGLLTKLQELTSNSGVHIYGPDETRRLYELVADGHSDTVSLPIICLRRKGGITLKNPNRTQMSKSGLTLDMNSIRSVSMNGIPILLEYQIDIYCRYREEADEYLRELVFTLLNNPTFHITLPYKGDSYEEIATVHFSPDIEDNSDIPERLIPGQFTRYTMNLSVNDAYLWDIKQRDSYRINKVEVELPSANVSEIY